MRTPGRRLPAYSPTRPCHQNRLTRAVQWTGRLLCWSLAAGMTTAATELLFAPQASWWPALWPLPWYLTCVTALTWAILRAREKAAQHPPEEDTLPDQRDQAA
ncbi:hypothetical protein ACFVOK_23820 [Streptomyces sp. NPDC057798]|uniref:hypothetical protein n=1 Tax=Streptomyces sp. NPDC057798 TaxID=3346252 RepID=UPI0036A88C94